MYALFEISLSPVGSKISCAHDCVEDYQCSLQLPDYKASMEKGFLVVKRITNISEGVHREDIFQLNEFFTQ